MIVSIQPKPKKGLEVYYSGQYVSIRIKVSIQPKPKKGLEALGSLIEIIQSYCFNPAEAEEGFRSIFIII